MYNTKNILKYPDELHNLNNDFLLAPEQFEIKRYMVSQWYKGIAENYGIKVGGVKIIFIVRAEVG